MWLLFGCYYPSSQSDEYFSYRFKNNLDNLSQKYDKVHVSRGLECKFKRELEILINENPNVIREYYFFEITFLLILNKYAPIKN